MKDRKIRWGIMGAGNISRKFASDLAESRRAELVAVASRSIERAKKFAKEFEISRTYGNYEEFVQDQDVDIVYIGTLHPMHKEGMLLCLKAGKAVLCEKPFTMDANEAEQIIQIARAQKTFVMEAMWTRYLPAIVQTRKWIEEGRIGEVKTMTANFGFNIGWNPASRLLNKKMGGGALLDVGVYPVSFASMIFRQQPANMMSSAHIGKTGVDERFSALFEYSENRTALFSAAVRLKLANDAFIYGTEGYIQLPDFYSARSAFLFRSDGVTEEFNDHRQSHGYIFEAEEAMQCFLEGRQESPLMPLDETLNIMKTMDSMRNQWGVVVFLKE